MNSTTLPDKSGSALRYLAALALLHRIESTPFLVPASAWGAALLAGMWTTHASTILLAVLLNIGIAYAGLLGNSYADYELDLGSTEKRRLTGAVELLGRRRVLALYVLENALLAAAFYRYADDYASPYASLFFWSSIGGRYLYNFRPFRLKERGMMNAACYAFNFGVAPVLLAWSMVSISIPPGLCIFVLGTWLLLCAQSLWGAAADYQSDQASGAATCAVSVGLRQAIRLSQWAMLLSLPAVVAGQVALGATSLDGRWGLGMLLIVAGYAYSVVGRWSAVRAAWHSENLLGMQLKRRVRELSWLVVQSAAMLAGMVLLMQPVIAVA